MKKLAVFTLLLFFVGCNNTSTEADEEDADTEVMEDEPAVEDDSMEEEVTAIFTCNSLSNADGVVLSLVMEQYNKTIPVDTTMMCSPKNVLEAENYNIPEPVNAIAEAGDYVYYSYIENNQLVIMRSPKGSGAMNYEVHMSVPVEAAMNTPE